MAARTLALWENGTFLESVVAAPDGAVYVANHEAGSIDRARDGRVERFAKLPGAVTGLLRLPDGALLATGRAGGAEAVYRIEPAGGVSVLAMVPGGGFLNGMTLLNDSTALVADSNAAMLWRVDLGTRQVSPWARNPLLGHADPATRFPHNTGFPAANGVKRRGDAVYVSNSGRGVILRIPVGADDQAAGPASVWASDIVADDFAFDTEGNAYVPTHPRQSVVRLSADGTRRTTVATVEQGLTGPTAVTVAPDGALLVVGNAAIPIEGERRASALLRLAIGGASAAAPTAPKQIAPPQYMLVTAPTVPDSDARRGEHGPAYLRFLESQLGRIAFGGQVKDAAGQVVERVYMVRADTPGEARALMEGSPYFQNRVYGPLTARPLQGMLGGLLGGVAWPAEASR